jgi:hypothetical protein
VNGQERRLGRKGDLGKKANGEKRRLGKKGEWGEKANGDRRWLAEMYLCTWYVVGTVVLIRLAG